MREVFAKDELRVVVGIDLRPRAYFARLGESAGGIVDEIAIFKGAEVRIAGRRDEWNCRLLVDLAEIPHGFLFSFSMSNRIGERMVGRERFLGARRNRMVIAGGRSRKRDQQKNRYDGEN